MSRNRRLLVAAMTAVTLFSAIVLAAGLSALQVGTNGASTIPQRETPPTTPEAGAPETAVEAHAETLPERTLLPMILLAVALGIVVIFMLVTIEGRKMLVYAVLMLLLLFFVMLLRERPAGPTQKSSPTPAAESAETPALSPSPFAFEPSPGLILAASLGVALLLVGAVALAGMRLARRRRSPYGAGPRIKLAEEARQALADLRAGVNLRDAIIRCYHDMSRTLQQYRGLRRSPAMTPEEFARGLASTDLPQADIWRITTLFERVRYGQHAPAPEEEAAAVACLTAIIRACEETA